MSKFYITTKRKFTTAIGKTETIGGKTKYFRSGWERKYCKYLQWLKERGEIKEWSFEVKTFWFLNILRGTRSYLPDFEVTLNDGTIEYHEVKGYMDAKSKTKLKRMKKYYPEVIVKLIDGTWFKANKNLALIIKGYNEPAAPASAPKTKKPTSTKPAKALLRQIARNATSKSKSRAPD